MSATISIHDMLDRDVPTTYARVKVERGLRPLLTLQIGNAMVLVPYCREHATALAALLREAAHEVELMTGVEARHA